MIPFAVQLSHEELLVALALLGLPAPLALGPRPSAAYSPVELGAALATALGSMNARGLTMAANPDELPTPAEPLAALVRPVALAERCLVVAERRANRRDAAHLSAHGSSLVLHRSPEPRVHRLETVAGVAGAAAWLHALVAPTASTAASPPLAQLTTTSSWSSTRPTIAAPAAALAAALDALEAGLCEAGAAILEAAGMPPNTADELLVALGSAPTRLTLAVVGGLRSDSPWARSALALSGTDGVWWGTAEPTGELLLRPLAAVELERELDALLALLVEPALAPLAEPR